MRKTQRYKHFNFFFFYLFYTVEFKINTEYLNRDWIVVYIHKYIYCWMKRIFYNAPSISETVSFLFEMIYISSQKTDVLFPKTS